METLSMSVSAPVASKSPAYVATCSANRSEKIADSRPTSPGPVSASDRLAERVVQALFATGYAKLRRITILADGSSVVLQGQVPSYYLKQVAQATVQGLDGVVQVVNQIRVTDSPTAVSAGLGHDQAQNL
jgi:osmotically-inducible protein OsmY